MKAILLFISLLLIFSNTLFSQAGSCNNWYFGIKAGITFNTAIPTPITTSSLITQEGCSSVSNNRGNILFYTDGITVYDRTNGIMPNGSNLFGHPSSSQSSIIIPKPGTFNALLGRYNNYYIVTVDYNKNAVFGIPGEGTHGVCFSEVDMTLNAGKGDVITSSKNTYLFGSYTTEKITVAKHANGCDFWVIARPASSTDFYSYLISSSGFSVTPVISTIPGSATSPTLAPGVGYMKASPNNKLVALINGYSPGTAAFYQNGLFVYDFNNTTGILSSKFYHASSGSAQGFPYAFTNARLGYGVEFSPNSNLIYTTGLYGTSVQQYDVSVATNALFQASRKIIGITTSPAPDGNNYTVCALQLGPNGKMYVALDGNDSISVIDNPNVYGLGCNYQDRIQPVGSGAKVSKYGLPNFVPSLISPVNKILMLDSCVLSPVRFVLTDTTGILTYNWVFTPLTATTTIFSSTSSSVTVSFPSTSSYIASLTLSYLCYNVILKDTFSVGPPSVSVTVTNPILCNGGTATVSATVTDGISPYVYSWQSNISTTNTAIYTAGSYSLQVKDKLGCKASKSFTITQPPVLTSTVSFGSILCNAGTTTISVAASGGVSPYTGTGTFTVPANTYTYSVSDNNSCTTSSVINITQPPILSAIISGTTSSNCSSATGSATISASGGTPAFTYSWTPPSPALSFTTSATSIFSLAAGAYTATVIDANGCKVTRYFNIVNPPTPTLSISSNSLVLCSGTSAIITPTLTATAVSYSLNGVATTPNFTVSPTATTVYTINATDAANCVSNSATITITVNTTPTLAISISNTAICSGASATITPSGASTYTLLNTGVAITTNTIVSPSSTTIYTVSSTGASGCVSATKTVTLIVNATPIVSLSAISNTICSGTTATLTATGADTYSWTAGPSTNTYTVNPSTTTVYEVTGTYSLTGCTSNVKTLTLTVNTTPTLSANATPVTVCSNGTISLNVSGASTYTWSGIGITPGNQNSSNPSFASPSIAIYTYSVIGTSPENCTSAMETVTVSVVGSPSSSLAIASQTLCEGTTTSFSIASPQGGVVYTWNGSTIGTDYSVPSSLTNVSGTYTIDVTAILGVGSATCGTSNTATLLVAPTPSISVDQSTVTICNNEEVTFTINNPLSAPSYYLWSFNNSIGNNLIISNTEINQTGSYSVTVTDANGCLNYTTINLVVNNCEVFIPEIFSPNGDGKNDAFEIKEVERYPNNTLQIFNRWGNIVYSKNSYQNDWKGTNDKGNGKILPEGTYYVIFDFGDNKTKTYHGYLQLVY